MTARINKVAAIVEGLECGAAEGAASICRALMVDTGVDDRGRVCVHPEVLAALMRAAGGERVVVGRIIINPGGFRPCVVRDALERLHVEATRRSQ